MFLEAGVPLPRACHSPGTPPPHQAGKTNWPQGEAAGGESRPTRQAQRAGLAPFFFLFSEKLQEQQ